jgi:hypothetical protein
MKTVATLGPSVRLVVFQFLMKTAQVPSIIPQKRASVEPPLPPVSGVQVMESTPKVNLFRLASKLDCRNEYELVDVWKKSHDTNWKMCFVRFVFCRKEHLNPLSAEFVNKVGSFEKTLVDFVSDNLWATQAYLNPYFEDAKPSGQYVLMFGCAGRTPDTEIFSGGRDEDNCGIGPKVLLSTMSPRLDIVEGKTVTLEVPVTAVPENVSFSAAHFF